MITQKYINEISYEIVGGVIEVHKQVGPGLLESVYHSCLMGELESVGLQVESQVQVPVNYKGKNIGGILRLDLLINNLIIVELKAVDLMLPLYKAQLLSYLKLAGMPKGLLINFHCENITQQLVSLVTKDFAILPKD